jgi:hypothetical protein
LAVAPESRRPKTLAHDGGRRHPDEVLGFAFNPRLEADTGDLRTLCIAIYVMRWALDDHNPSLAPLGIGQAEGSKRQIDTTASPSAISWPSSASLRNAPAGGGSV